MAFVHVLHGADGTPRPGLPKPTVRLEHLEPQHDGPFAGVRWLMHDDLGYEPPAGTPGLAPFYVAPAHQVGQSTDLASVPPWLWGVIASFGRHTLAALLHDFLCDEARRAPVPRSARLRREADRVFRVAMRDLRVPALRGWIMWAAVRLFGEAGQPGLAAKAPAAAVLTVVAATWWAVVAAATGGPAGAAALAATGTWLAAPLLAGARRRRDLAGAILVGGPAGALVAPALLVSMATVLVLDGPEILAWAVRKAASRIPRSPVDDPGSMPRFGPMRTP